jgi:hypothetical protein
MASNLDLIEKAFRLIGVLAEGETASSEQGSDALTSMNDLFNEWAANDIDIGYYPQTSLSADSPIFADAIQAAKYSLAILLGSEYGVSPSPAVAAVASSGYKRLLRDAQVSKQEGVDMSHLSGGSLTENIETGE